MNRKLVYSPIWIFSFIFSGLGCLVANNVHTAKLANPERIDNPTLALDFPVRKPLTCKPSISFLEFVQLACEIEGRTDNTCVRSSTGLLARRSNPTNSKGAAEINTNNYASPGQNIKTLTSPDKVSGQVYHDPEISSYKRITSAPTINHPLSFAWEQLETKK